MILAKFLPHHFETGQYMLQVINRNGDIVNEISLRVVQDEVKVDNKLSSKASCSKLALASCGQQSIDRLTVCQQLIKL